MDKRISKIKRQKIYDARQQFESDVEQLYSDRVFELAVKLNLDEKIVQKEFDESI